MITSVPCSPYSCAQMKSLGCACFSTSSRIALRTHMSTNSAYYPQHTSLVDSSLSDGRWSDTSVRPCHREAPGAPSTWCNDTNMPSSRSSQIRTQRTLHTSLWLTRCTTLLCNKLYIMLNVKIFVRKCITRTSVGQSGSGARTARSTSYEPNLSK